MRKWECHHNTCRKHAPHRSVRFHWAGLHFYRSWVGLSLADLPQWGSLVKRSTTHEVVWCAGKNGGFAAKLGLNPSSSTYVILTCPSQIPLLCELDFPICEVRKTYLSELWRCLVRWQVMKWHHYYCYQGHKLSKKWRVGSCRAIAYGSQCPILGGPECQGSECFFGSYGASGSLSTFLSYWLDYWGGEITVRLWRGFQSSPAAPGLPGVAPKTMWSKMCPSTMWAFKEPRLSWEDVAAASVHHRAVSLEWKQDFQSLHHLLGLTLGNQLWHCPGVLWLVDSRGHLSHVLGTQTDQESTEMWNNPSPPRSGHADCGSLHFSSLKTLHLFHWHLFLPPPPPVSAGDSLLAFHDFRVKRKLWTQRELFPQKAWDGLQ